MLQNGWLIYRLKPPVRRAQKFHSERKVPVIGPIATSIRDLSSPSLFRIARKNMQSRRGSQDPHGSISAIA